MKEAKFVLSAAEMDAAFAADSPYRVRFGWLHDRLHRWSHRFGFHDALIGNRFYRWWGRQTYGPSNVQEASAELAKAIDAEILRRYTEEK